MTKCGAERWKDKFCERAGSVLRLVGRSMTSMETERFLKKGDADVT